MNPNVNPFTLFLILILLILGTQPNLEDELEKITNTLDAMKETTTHFRIGIARIQSIMG